MNALAFVGLSWSEKKKATVSVCADEFVISYDNRQAVLLLNESIEAVEK